MARLGTNKGSVEEALFASRRDLFIERGTLKVAAGNELNWRTAEALAGPGHDVVGLVILTRLRARMVVST